MREPDLTSLMSVHRLKVSEVAKAAGVSRTSVLRLRSNRRTSIRPRPETIRRIAEAVAELTQLDAGETYLDLLASTGQASANQQTALGLRGAAQLTSYYHRMSPLARHILLEQARLLAREMPDTPDEADQPE